VIRTLIAMQPTLIRAGLASLLSCADDIEIVAEVARGDQVVRVAQGLVPDVAVLGAALPGTDGFAVAVLLHAALPSCHSLIIGEWSDPSVVWRVVAAHATGFVAREARPDYITEAIKRAARGRKVMDPDLAFAALNAARNPLTSREIDALRIAAEGATTAEIAERLYVSVGTVRNYLSRSITKTGARNRVDAIRIASGSGWL
jgi:two-component system, NarL family, response regulator DesR